MTVKHSLHTYVASVFFKGGAEREIHCDLIQSIPHGFNFCREDGSFDFLAGDTVDSMDVVRAASAVKGSA